MSRAVRYLADAVRFLACLLAYNPGLAVAVLIVVYMISFEIMGSDGATAIVLKLIGFLFVVIVFLDWKAQDEDEIRNEYRNVEEPDDTDSDTPDTEEDSL